MNNIQPRSPALTIALQKYCVANGLHTGKKYNYRNLAARMNFGYQRAWNLLNGKAPVTVEVLGRFLLAFGPAASGELLQLAGSPNDADRRIVSAETEAAHG